MQRGDKVHVIEDVMLLWLKRKLVMNGLPHKNTQPTRKTIRLKMRFLISLGQLIYT